MRNGVRISLYFVKLSTHISPPLTIITGSNLYSRISCPVWKDTEVPHWSSSHAFCPCEAASGITVLLHTLTHRCGENRVYIASVSFQVQENELLEKCITRFHLGNRQTSALVGSLERQCALRWSLLPKCLCLWNHCDFLTTSAIIYGFGAACHCRGNSEELILFFKGIWKPSVLCLSSWVFPQDFAFSRTMLLSSASLYGAAACWDIFKTLRTAVRSFRHRKCLLLSSV